MYKKILVPLDGSKRSEAILPHVESLAKSYRAAVIFLKVIEHPFATGIEGSLTEYGVKRTDELEAAAKPYFEQLLKDFRQKDLQCDFKMVHGPVVDGILQVANEVGADMVAMTSHGHTGLSRVFYGSVASGIVNKIDRPLLMIRSRKA